MTCFSKFNVLSLQETLPNPLAIAVSMDVPTNVRTLLYGPQLLLLLQQQPSELLRPRSQLPQQPHHAKL